MPEPTPFRIQIDDAVLADLDDRLARTRLPSDFANDDWRYGTPSPYLAELIAYWRRDYDWRAVETRMNAFDHFRVTIDTVPVHFLRARGVGPNPVPLVLSHGWPWTFWDFEKVIGPLSDPGAHGGDPADAFDVVVPSLPGYGFSTPLTTPGIHWWRTADLWVKLMTEVLGYERFGAQGGDWGSLVSAQIGHKYADRAIGVHLSLAFPMDFFTAGLPGIDAYSEADVERFHHTKRRMAVATSHVAVQTDDPQTIGVAMNDSPAGLLAWILERRRNWSDSKGDVESVFSKEDLVTTATLYWVTESYTTSARYYFEAAKDPWRPAHDRHPVVEAPTAISLFPEELALMPDAYLKSYYNLVQLTEMPRGGHFAPAEQPALLVEDVRAFFRKLR